MSSYFEEGDSNMNINKTVNLLNIYLKYIAHIKTDVKKGKIIIYKKTRSENKDVMKLVKKKEYVGTREEIESYLSGMLDIINYREEIMSGPSDSHIIMANISKLLNLKGKITYQIIDLVIVLLENNSVAEVRKMLAEIDTDATVYTVWNYIAFANTVKHLRRVGVKDEFIRKYPINLWRRIYKKIDEQNLNEMLVMLKKYRWKIIEILKKRSERDREQNRQDN